MYLVCGLGNPGREYEATRHNLGFIAAEALASRLDIKTEKLRFKALIKEGRVGDEKILIARPQTYMNLSGVSVREIADFYKIEPKKIIVIYDDVELPVGALRIRPFGGPGTHNGMKSVTAMLGTEGFPRIRIGTGQDREIPLMNFVLSKWSEDERPLLAAAAEDAAKACECIFSEGLNYAMNKYNKKPNNAGKI